MKGGRDPREPAIWGTTPRRRLPTPAVIAGGGLLLVLLVGGVGYLMAQLVRVLMSSGSPLGAAVCLGGVVLTGLALGIVGVRAVAARLGDGSSSRRAFTLGGLILLMALAPFLMIVVVVTLAVQAPP